MEYTKNSIVKKSNILVNAHCKLGINEQKILYKIISCIHVNDKDFKDYELKIADIMKFLDDKSQNYYTELKKYTRNLVKQLLIFEEDGKEIQTHWVSLAEYKDSQTILFNFHPRLKPYLIELKSHFTRFGLDNIRKFRSKYSPKLYEMLKQFENTGYRIITVKELRKILCLGDKYKKYNDFKKNVLLIPQHEIKGTDIRFEFVEIKEGKIIDKIHFYIEKVKEEKNNTGMNFNPGREFRNETIEKIDLSNDKIDNIKAKIKNIIDEEIKDKKIIEWIEKKKESDINFYLDNWSKWDYKTKATKAGFFIDVVDNNRPLPSGEKGLRANLDKPPQELNYEQRNYKDCDDDYWHSFYDNVTFTKNK